MTDYFALLGEQRRPWLDTNALKANFLALSADYHPDRIHAGPQDQKSAAHERFAALNSAYQCLREPKERLRHLLELECGTKPMAIDQAPSAAMDLFLQVGSVCRDTDSFLAERDQATSPLLKAQFFERGLEWIEELNAVQPRLEAGLNRLFSELQALNTAWEEAPAVGAGERGAALPLARLEQIYRELSYLTRWMRQIQERKVRLSL